MRCYEVNPQCTQILNTDGSYGNPTVKQYSKIQIYLGKHNKDYQNGY